MNLLQIYNKLLEKYGEQNWWPVISKNEKNHEFEIIIGTILTQNTSWKNVEKAIQNLDRENLLNAEKILEIDKQKLIELIKPAGYYNQKSEYLKSISELYLKNKNPTRRELLEVKGIGKETADSTLLYAFNKPYFVIDAYTKRIFSCSLKKQMNYDELQDFFHKNLPQDTRLYKEYHALIVEHCKNICKKKPECEDCFLKHIFQS